jgi:glycosyltransferase involved in cell wall biosynthesis
MTLTEAAACGTPAVVTRIAGHVDAVAEGRSGLLADGRDELLDGMDRVLSDPGLRAQLSAGASDHAARFTWAATARGTLEVLAAEAMLRRRHP